MANNRECTPLSLSPSMAVADAMMRVQAVYLQDHIREQMSDPLLVYGIDRLEREIQYQSKKYCAEASVYALNHLYTTHRKLFTHYTLIEGVSTKRKPLRLVGEHPCQVYFLLRDTSGVWHAGSPANHTPENENSLLTRKLTNRNLAFIMQEIEATDGGSWPSPSDMERIIDHFYHDPVEYPGDSGNLTIFTLCNPPIEIEGLPSFRFESFNTNFNNDFGPKRWGDVVKSSHKL